MRRAPGNRDLHPLVHLPQIQRARTSRIRIAVAANLLAHCAHLPAPKHLAAAPPVRNPRALQMRNDHGRTSRPPDRKRLAHRVAESLPSRCACASHRPRRRCRASWPAQQPLPSSPRSLKDTQDPYSAPARHRPAPRCNCACMAAISSSVAARSSLSIWLLRSAVCPTSAATFTAGFASFDGRHILRKGRITKISALAQQIHRIRQLARRRTGDALIPQLPTITVVTPCDSFGSICGAAHHTAYRHGYARR